MSPPLNKEPFIILNSELVWDCSVEVHGDLALCCVGLCRACALHTVRLTLWETSDVFVFRILQCFSASYIYLDFMLAFEDKCILYL